MEKIKLKKIALICVSILLIFLFIIGICPINIQNDIFFDIKVGENYVKNGINTNDIFSYHENLKYVSHHFLVNIITYLVYNFTGIKGLYILELLLASVLAFLFYKANKIYVKNSVIAYFFVFLELFFMASFISQRAQMYSYLLFLIEIICIEKFLRTSKKKYLVVLTLVPLLIVNFHAGVLPFYFIIMLVYMINYFNVKIIKFENEKIFKSNLKYLFIPIILGIIFMFCNPFFIDGVLYSFKTLSNEFINNHIMEFQPSNIYNNIYYYIFILCILFAYILSNKKIKTHQLLLILGTSFMTLLSLRHFSLLIIVSVTNMDIIEELILDLYNYSKKGILPQKQMSYKKALIALCVFGIVMVARASFVKMDKNLISDKFYATKAVAYIKNNIPKEKKLFNDYSWGSLLMLNDIKVFIDSRCDLYTEEYNPGVTVAKDYVDAKDCKNDYATIFEKYNIDYIFIKQDSNLNQFLKNDINYNKIYSDELAIIYEVKK